ncbi:MAG TPA: hypothetical protein VHZ50_07960 [Puia sp.]|nr:hypothetical protein [Puia sp.]
MLTITGIYAGVKNINYSILFAMSEPRFYPYSSDYTEKKLSDE